MGRNYCVYVHTNRMNGKKYVGMSNNLERRWGREGIAYKSSPRFYCSIQHHGWEVFESEVIYDKLTYEEACELEIETIAKLNTTDGEIGYNISHGGKGGRVYHEHPRGMLGKSQSEHQKQVSREYMSNPETNPMMNGTTVLGKTLPHPSSKNVQVTNNKGDVKRFFTIKECADYFGFSKAGMRCVIMRNKPYKGWKKELHGYVFEFLPKGSVEFKP